MVKQTTKRIKRTVLTAATVMVLLTSTAAPTMAVPAGEGAAGGGGQGVIGWCWRVPYTNTYICWP